MPLYPPIYCPVGIERPVHCFDLMQVVIKKPNVGPDGTSGTCWGGAYVAKDKPFWAKTTQGWWVKMAGFQPQDLLKLDPNARVLKHHLVEGERGHWWKVPVLIQPVDVNRPECGFQSALNHTLTQDGWSVPAALSELQKRLMLMVRGVQLHKNQEKRNQIFRETVVAILGITHVVSLEEIMLGQWASQLLFQHVFYAAIDTPYLAAEDARARQTTRRKQSRGR